MDTGFMPRELSPGQRLAPDEAKGFVDEFYRRQAVYWDQKVMRSTFMTELAKGSLPMPVIRRFFLNWGAFTIEVNTIAAAIYQRHITFFKANRDLMAPLGMKIADEFIHPEPPGHYLVMMKTANALGLNEDEIFNNPIEPAYRGKIDFYRSLLYEGTVAEYWASISGEETIGLWSGAWYRALTTHYGFTSAQATYFGTHEEADLEEHEEGVMGHGAFNRVVLQRLLETGQATERPGYGLSYCARAIVETHAMMQDASLNDTGR